MASPGPLRFGAFFAPFHPVGQSPTLALEYDLERTVELDRLGYDEAWFGEHHSGGYELIGCPEIFIAAAAERTKHIKLGTGVMSLPYHHPWLVADRLNLLDHLTRGRLIFGAGPGALPSDAYIMGINPVDQRRMMEESLEAILALLRSDEPVSREADWFTMREARLQMRPYTHPHPEVAVAAMISPSGPRLAGTYGVSLLSLSMSVAEGFAGVGQAWGVVEEMAAKVAAPAPDRRTWRVLGTMHLAESRDRAIDDCTYGLKAFADYFGGGAGFVPLANRVDGGPQTPRLRGGLCRLGQRGDRHARRRRHLHRGADRAVGRVRHLPDAGPRLGRPRRTLESYRLFAREVIPHFQGHLGAPRASHEWATAKRGELFGGPGTPSSTPSPATSTKAASTSAAGSGDGASNGGGVMRAAVLRDGRMVVRDDVPEPVPPGPGAGAGPGMWHLRVGPALRPPRRHHAGPRRGDGGPARPGPASPRPGERRVHGPRVLRRGARGGPRHPGPGGGHAGDLGAGHGHADRHRRPRLQQRPAHRLRRADAPVPHRWSTRCPTGSIPGTRR